VLAQADDGTRCLLVDVADLADAVSWTGAGAEHLAAVTDLVRTPQGMTAVLPLCTQPLQVFLARRSGGAPLSAGETVTLAVSVIRGAAEALSRVPDGPCGDWWLDDSGRPVLVGGGEQSAVRTAGEVVQRMRADADATLSGALALAAEVLADPRRVSQEAAEVEASLFAAARAEPVATSVLTHASPRAVPAGADGPPGGGEGPRWWDAVAGNVDAGLGDLVSRIATTLWRRVRADRPSTGRKKHPLIAAGVAGAVVLGAGLLWPRGADDPAIAEPRHPSSTSASPARSPSPAPPTATTAAAPQETAAIATELLNRRAACGSTTCRAATQEDPDAHFTADVSAQEKREVVLLDDFGGAAVLRIASAAGDDRFVVIVQKDGKWLLRDIRDVAEQPEG